MHISEGVLNIPILGIGTIFAIVGLTIGLKKLDENRLPEAALLAATSFLASLISVPFGPTKVHLIFNGLLGILLGWGAFPALFIGLVLQAIFFQFGGLTTLGINTFNIGLPAIVCFWIFKGVVRIGGDKLSVVGGFIAGFGAVLGSSILMTICLVNVEKEFFNIAKIIVLAYLPIMAIEGLITAMVVFFLAKVFPTMLSHSNF